MNRSESEIYSLLCRFIHQIDLYKFLLLHNVYLLSRTLLPVGGFIRDRIS
jgi:hypothetical protein